MRKIAAIGLALVAFAATGLPALADGRAWDAPHAQAHSPKYVAAQRPAPTRYSDYAQYNDARYGDYASSGYAQWMCTYSGGPKSSSWACQ
jgi:hypothetical protein